MRKILVVFSGIVCLLALPILIIWGLTFPNRSLSRKLDQLEPESYEIPAYMLYDTLYWGENKLNLGRILDDESVRVEKALVICEGRIWFAYSKGDTWYLASVTESGEDFQIHCSAQLMADARALWKEGKLLLADSQNIVEYDMETGKITEFSASAYPLLISPYQWQIKDHQTVTISDGQNIQILTPEAAAASSEAFRKLLSMKTEEIWNGMSPLNYLMDQMTWDGENLYLICRVLSKTGGTHAMVFQYDFDQNTCAYSFHTFMVDIIGDGLYVVPQKGT